MAHSNADQINEKYKYYFVFLTALQQTALVSPPAALLCWLLAAGWYQVSTVLLNVVMFSHSEGPTPTSHLPARTDGFFPHFLNVECRPGK